MLGDFETVRRLQIIVAQSLPQAELPGSVGLTESILCPLLEYSRNVRPADWSLWRAG
jgi:hypothetical protein